MDSQDDRNHPRTSQRTSKGIPPWRNDEEGYQWRSSNPEKVAPTQGLPSQQQSLKPVSCLDGLEDWMEYRMGENADEDELRREDRWTGDRQSQTSLPGQRQSPHCGMSSYSLVSLGSKKSSKSVSSVLKMEQLVAEIEAQEELNKLAEEESKIQAELTRDRVARQQNLIKMKLELRKASLEENLDDSISVSQRSRVTSVHSKVSSWIKDTTSASPPCIPDITPRRKNDDFYSFQTPLVPEPNQIKSTPNKPIEVAVSDVVTSTPINYIDGESHQQASGSIKALVQAMTTAFSKISPAAAPQGESSITTTKFLARQTHAKELPTFYGTAEEWIIFFTAYKRSTEVCGFTDDENLHRLRKSLKGDAYKTVQSLLTTPENVPKIISKLEMRFGQPEHIINAMTSRVRAVQAPKEDKLETVIEFGLTVDNLVSTMIALKCRDHLPNPILLNELEKKLPVSYQIRWIKWTMENSFKSKNLEMFAEWLNIETEVACRLCPPKARSEQEKDNRNQPNKQDRKQIFATAEYEPRDRNLSDDPHQKSEKVCYRCNRNHHTLGDCKTFARDSEDSRWNLVTENKLCFGCLRPGHWTSKCNSKKQCGVDGCKSIHHYLLHKKTTRRINLVDAPNPPSLEDPEPRHVNHASQKGEHQTFLKIVPVILKGTGPDIHMFGFLDEGAEVTLIEEDVANKAQMLGIRKPLVMQWTNDVQRTEENSRIVDVKVSGAYRGAKTFEMRGVRTIKDLSLPHQTVNQEELAKHWPHLNAAQLKSYQNAKPTILIGGDNAHLIVSRQVVEGPLNSPLLSKTRLGWVIHGKDDMSSRKSSSKFVFHICNREDSDGILHRMVKDTFKTESFGVKVQSEKPKSREDKRTKLLMDSTTERVGDRWETGPQWKQDNIKLPDSTGMAFHRLQIMEKKMDKEPNIATWYTEKIKDYEAKGYVKKLSPEEATVIKPKTWYLPNFFALHPHKPDKKRLVFDAAAKPQGVSAKAALVQGPDLLNLLLSVLMKFRQKKYAFTADIKDMFHQVKIRKEDLLSQRFLWKGTDRERDPDTFEIQVMFFGATSSPSSAVFVKNDNAEEFQDEFPDAYWTIFYKPYVDDYLDSTDTSEGATQAIKDVIDVHQRGGFNICNWTNNSREILEKIPEDLHAKEVKELDTRADLPTGRVLGLWWNHEKDVFTWILKFHKVQPEILDGKKTPTKREVLKLVMSLFDPLGFLAHFVNKAKILLQGIWRSEIGWDDEIPIRSTAWILKFVDNCRNPKDPEELTPNHLLIGKSSGISCPGTFAEADLCLRRQWRISQRMADQFWMRWRKEYLPSILRTTKWHWQRDPVKAGDVVLVVDDLLTRNSWPLGLVTATFPGRDGVIRVADVKTTSGTYRRSVSKICVLDVNQEVKENSPLRGPECCGAKWNYTFLADFQLDDKHLWLDVVIK